MSELLIETALRSLFVALVVWAGMQVLRMRNVLAQKAAWSGVLGAALLMPLLVTAAAHWPVLPGTAGVVLHANPMTLLEELRATLESRRAASRRPSQSAAPAPNADAPQIEDSTAPPQPRSSSDDSSSSGASNESSDELSNTRKYQYREASPIPVDSNSGVEPVNFAQRHGEVRPFAVPPAVLAGLLYVVVVVALLSRLLYGLGSALRIWRTAEPVKSERVITLTKHAGFGGMPLRASAAVASPVTIGSAVVLPADYASWDVEKLRIVLAHERSHIRQGDFYLQLLAGLYATVFWFSPLGWWLKRKLSDLAEAISDRAALSEAGSRSDYAQILLEFAAAPRPTLIGVAMARSGRLSQRIERLLNDNSFRQAFAGTRRRALLSVLLVPVALFAATALIRVQAAGQQPQGPAPASQPASAPQALPAASQELPVTGQAHPDQAVPVLAGPDQGVDAAPLPPDQATLPPAAPKATPGLPAPPAKAGVAAIAPGASVTPPLPRMIEPIEPLPPVNVHVPGINIHQPPVDVHMPAFNVHAPAIDVHVPSMGIQVPTLEGGAYVMARAGQDPTSSRGYSYRYSSNGDSYAVIAGDERQHMSFSGDIHMGEIDKARKMAHGDFLWFAHAGKSYVIDDPAIVGQIEAMYKPMEALGKQQEELGRKQAALGEQQAEMGRRQEQASIPTPDISKEMTELNAAMAKLQTKMGKTVTREELADLQGKLGELQGRLGALQGEMGSRMGEFGEQQGRLGAEQGKLGAEQGRLGAEQGRIAMEADRKVKSIIDESLKDGKAKPVQ